MILYMGEPKIQFKFGIQIRENDDVLEFEQYVSNSNIAKIECMRFCDKQITLSIKSMFVGENKAIK